MKLFWLLLIGFQLYLAAGFALQPFNAARGSYRHEERAAAFQAMGEHPSPETKAALQRELRLNAKHILDQQFMLCGVIIIVFVLFYIACYYGWRNFRQNFGYKSPPSR